jgi:hypothetical protein
MQCLQIRLNVLFNYGWLAARSRFTHATCGLARVVRITESLGKRLDQFRSETDQTYWGSQQPRDYCTSSYVRQNFLGAPIRIAVHPCICLCACNGVRYDERMFMTSDKKNYESLSSHFNFHFYCIVATTTLHQDLSRSMLRNSRKPQHGGKRHTDVCSHARIAPLLGYGKHTNCLKHLIYLFTYFIYLFIWHGLRHHSACQRMRQNCSAMRSLP